MARNELPPKIGAGHASAMYRLGLAELRAAVVPSDSNIVQPAQYGLYGTKTPGEIMQEKRLDVRDLDEQPSILDDKLNQAETPRGVREPAPREPERD